MLTDKQRTYQREWYHQNVDERRRASRERMRVWRAKNPELAKASNKKWRGKNPNHLKDYLLSKTYGITLKERDALFQRQDSKCAICRSATTAGNGWHVDHCHKTKRVRGILCNHCNLTLGHAKENPDILVAAARYLEIKR
jgi:hypothetical protein